MPQHKVTFSIIVPLLNEEMNVGQLHEQIKKTMSKMGKSFEIIFIDDYSTDNTIKNCHKLSPLTLIALRRQSGQTAAMSAGIKTANGEYIITMDGDLQNDPEDIPGMYDHLVKNKLDVVSGWRKNRKDNISKHFISRGANALRTLIFKDNIHDSGCSLKIYRSECFDTIELFGEMHRFIPALVAMRGFKIGEVEVRHHQRKHGKTKYGFSRTIKGFLDILAIWFWQKFAGRPMHLLGGIGLLCWIFGGIFMLIAAYQKLFLEIDLSNTAFTMLAMFLFFFGLNFLMLGILFDIVVKNYYSVSQDKPWLIRKIWKLK